MSHHFPTPEECGRYTIFPGVTIRTAGGEKMLMSLVDLPELGGRGTLAPTRTGRHGH